MDGVPGDLPLRGWGTRRLSPPRLLPCPAAKRPTAEQALGHPWLAALHDPNDEPVCPRVRGWVGRSAWVGWDASSCGYFG